jgi:hypothetical protein
MPKLKIKKKEFLDYFLDEENQCKTAQQCATDLKISRVHYYNLRRKFRDSIADEAKKLAQSLAAEQVYNLKRNAQQKDTPAANSLLEIAKVRTKDSLLPDGQGWKITIEKVNNKEEAQDK